MSSHLSLGLPLGLFFHIACIVSSHLSLGLRLGLFFHIACIVSSHLSLGLPLGLFFHIACIVSSHLSLGLPPGLFSPTSIVVISIATFLSYLLINILVVFDTFNRKVPTRLQVVVTMNERGWVVLSIK